MVRPLTTGAPEPIVWLVKLVVVNQPKWTAAAQGDPRKGVVLVS